MAHRHNRSTTLIALGGGVIGDIAGFAAATYQRGVAFIQVPTTLLACVDSSVGGKTAVNHPQGKNMIGAFYQPRAGAGGSADARVVCRRASISPASRRSIKYGIIRDARFFDWLEAHVGELLRRDAAALKHAVLTSCAVKAAVVAVDEREDGVRAILNYGHTFGHAIETLTRYEYLHGEAVAIGMVMATDLSMRTGIARSRRRKAHQSAHRCLWLAGDSARKHHARRDAFGDGHGQEGDRRTIAAGVGARHGRRVRYGEVRSGCVQGYALGPRRLV